MFDYLLTFYTFLLFAAAGGFISGKPYEGGICTIFDINQIGVWKIKKLKQGWDFQTKSNLSPFFYKFLQIEKMYSSAQRTS